MAAKYTFQFPAGGRVKAKVLNWDTVRTLRDQCAPREILMVVAVTDGEKYYLTEQDTSLLSAFRSQTGPFLNDKRQAPVPAVYMVVLRENAEDMMSISLCGSFLEWLNQPNAQELSREYCGERLQYYGITGNTADAKYSIAVICNIVVVALDFSQHTEKMLSVEPPVNLINSSTTSSGAISGTVFTMAQILPYSIIFDMVSGYTVSGVLFTGEGLSGSVAHAAAILFRELFRTAESPPAVKAVSFSGPLCGSPSLHEHLASTAQKDNHTTVNCGRAILDRLLADFQRMSPLATTDMSSWKFVYDSVSVSLRSCLATLDGSVRVNLPALVQAEDNLRHHISVLPQIENILLPIGRYVIRRGGQENSIESDGNLMDVLTEMEATLHPPWRSHFSLRDVDIRTLPPPAFQIVREDYTPKITAVSMIQTPRRLTFNIEGKYLDTVQMRLLDAEVPIPSITDFRQLPLSLSAVSLSILPAARMLSVRCFPDKTIIEFAGLNLSGAGALSLKTDFGDTNALDFNDDNTVQGQESTPAKSLHPTMNAEFLSGAFLRVAICCKLCGGSDKLSAHNPGMAELLALLISLEGDICKFTDGELTRILCQFMDDQVDVGMLRHMSLSRFEEISRIATDPVKVEEALVYKGVRKVTGFAAQAVGGLLTFAGVLLSIPALVLALPVASVVNRVMQAEGTMTMGTAVYMGLVGIVGLPGMIVAAFGLFIAGAGAYANRDIPSHRYKQVLGNIITSLGGNPLEVVDELPQVEEYVVLRMYTLYPQVVLSRCSFEELVCAIDQSILKGIDEITTIGNRLKSNRQILAKLLLIGRIHGVRQLLRSNLMIGFVGVHNAGKSTSIERLFEVDAQSDMLKRTERVNAFCIGEWVNRVARERIGFKEWLWEKRRNEMQLYAVDFPGITDEREEIGSLTRYSAELASMFVVVVKAGHVAAPEKEAVGIAKAHHKPFIVIINHADTISHELKKPGNEERIRHDYANTLGVPSELIHFMNALDPYCNDKLRGILFGMLQTLIGDPDVVYALALRMVPPTVVADIDDELFGVPDTLAAAAYSLMFNLCTMRSSTLAATCEVLLRDSRRALGREVDAGAADLRTISFAVGDVLRQVALALNISPASYTCYAGMIHLRSIPFKIAMDQVGRTSEAELTNDMKKHLEMLVTTLTLSAIREQIHQYFGKPIPGATSTFAALSLEVLLGLQLICSKWMEIGFDQGVVESTCADLFGGTAPVSTSLFLQKLSVAQNANSILAEDGAETKSGEGQTPLSSEISRKNDALELHDVLFDFDFAEINRYTRGRDQLVVIRTSIFQPTEIDEMSNHTTRMPETDDELTQFKETVKKYTNDHLTEKGMLKVPSPTGDTKILPVLLAAFESLTVEQLTSMDIRFEVEDDEALDANGVTKAVFTKAAQELDSNPSSVFMIKDPSSGLIHPDPYMCIGLRTGSNTCPNPDDPSMMTVLKTYRALGRLLGFVAVKHAVGVTFPVNLSLSMYRVLLGRRIGMRDLEITDPLLAGNMETLCTSDESFLDAVGLFFEITLAVKKYDEETHDDRIVRSRNFELCPNGRNKRVTSQNLTEYVCDYMKTQLCCVDDRMTENVWRELLLGMQHVCPREHFNFLTPEALQLIVQGCPAIDVQEWMQYTDMNNVTATNAEVVSWFWSVVNEMTELDRVKLLVFVVGNSALPAKGFQDLYPQFTLLLDQMADINKLPTASVCFNRLYLPCYPSEERLREKLLYAIRNMDPATLGRV